MLIPFHFVCGYKYTIQLLLTQDQYNFSDFGPFYVWSSLKLLPCKALQGFEGKLPASFSYTDLLKSWGIEEVMRKPDLGYS